MITIKKGQKIYCKFVNEDTPRWVVISRMTESPASGRRVYLEEEGGTSAGCYYPLDIVQMMEHAMPEEMTEDLETMDV